MVSQDVCLRSDPPSSRPKLTESVSHGRDVTGKPSQVLRVQRQRSLCHLLRLVMQTIMMSVIRLVMQTIMMIVILSGEVFIL